MTFRDFMELALYHPEFGYYARAANPVGKGADYVTAPSLSPAFSFAISNLVRDFLRRCEGEVSTIADIGAGDGGLIESVATLLEDKNARFFGVDRELGRAQIQHATFVRTFDELPRDGAHLLFSNELFDAFPFARLVQRGEHLHELWVSERDGVLDWGEHEAPLPYEDYFAARGIELAEGQFADVTPEWEQFYEDLARFVKRGLIVTIDYGFAQEKLFHPRARRFGTAASYSAQRVTRDLLANPGEQDITAHINFTDLIRAGERNGMRTLFFDSLAKFLLSLGITEHALFQPVHEVAIDDAQHGVDVLQAREDARRLVLPDGIGEDLRVLVQEKEMGVETWTFERKLF
ncbi:MAG TPA: SAM-dependent methyltransferase [Thermoanaerobaculia bacterium]|nr:SAM-dependent methyltransferase [Thermoanaerobaculia bacterium]